VFVGPQIHELIHATDIEATMNPEELAAWKSFKDVSIGFLGVHREAN
jgi:hypothetical protein